MKLIAAPIIIDSIKAAYKNIGKDKVKNAPNEIS